MDLGILADGAFLATLDQIERLLALQKPLLCSIERIATAASRWCAGWSAGSGRDRSNSLRYATTLCGRGSFLEERVASGACAAGRRGRCVWRQLLHVKQLTCVPLEPWCRSPQSPQQSPDPIAPDSPPVRGASTAPDGALARRALRTGHPTQQSGTVGGRSRASRSYLGSRGKSRVRAWRAVCWKAFRHWEVWAARTVDVSDNRPPGSPPFTGGGGRLIGAARQGSQQGENRT